MKQFNRLNLAGGLLLVSACSIMTGCKDDKYDLSDLDTTSRITVDDLTIPVNLADITLDNVVKLEDNENIDTIRINGRKCYAISKGGSIETDDFSISPIHVGEVPINSVDFSVDLPTNSIPTIPGQTILPQPFHFDVDLPVKAEDMQKYHFNMTNIDDALIRLDSIKTQVPIKITVHLSIPPELINSDNQVGFKDLNIKLPKGLKINSTVPADVDYKSSTGKMVIPELKIGSDGKALLQINATGLSFTDNGVVQPDRSLSISGEIGVESAKIDFVVKSVNIPNKMTVDVDYSVSAFDLSSFSGEIDYKMNDIDIAPIRLSDLPDFLDSDETKLVIADPSITINVNNPVGAYGNITGSGQIKLSSKFKGNNNTDIESGVFSIGKDGAHLSFGGATEGYDPVTFNGLGGILANDNVGGLPEEIVVNIENLQFKGTAVEFPIGSTIGKAIGDYNFQAPLGFGYGTYVVYETTVDDLGSDDMDDLYINKLAVSAFCSNNLPVKVHLTVTPFDKYGREIPVTEDSSHFTIEPMSDNVKVNLTVQGKNGPIRDLDSIRFRAEVSQNSDDPKYTEALGPDLFIILKDLGLTVDGYYETSF